MLPTIVTCPNCGGDAELDGRDLLLDEVACPSCGTTIQPKSLQLPSNAWAVYGRFWRRFGAILIDGLVFLPFAIVSFVVMLKVTFWLFWPIQILTGVINAAYRVFLHARYGATLGKMATGLSVRNLNLQPIGWTEAVKRSSVDCAFLVVTAIGYVATILAVPTQDLVHSSFRETLRLYYEYEDPSFSFIETVCIIWLAGNVFFLLFSEKKRAIHDLIAGTVVVHKNSVPVDASIRPQSTAA